MRGSVARAVEAGRKIGDQFVKMMDEYRAHAAQGEAFKKEHGLRNPQQVRDAAIAFVLSNPGVHSVCPTINSFDELDAYTPLSGSRLKPLDSALLSGYETSYGRLYCRHACGECEASCPHGVPINSIMRYQHDFAAQGREKQAMEHYKALNRRNAADCLACDGPCNNACPHGVPIQALLAGAHAALSRG